MAWYAGPELLGLAELPAWPSMFVMPCSPTLTLGTRPSRPHSCGRDARAPGSQMDALASAISLTPQRGPKVA